jgi:SAM-dependent methyltransferase
MKLSNPPSRYKLKISKSSTVLDVGSGHNPHPRANVVTDKFIDSNYHRKEGIKVFQKQRFVEADGESLPFSDKEFDYVICCHVLEHVDNPTQFLKEIQRVGISGYIETPSLIGEMLIPKESHQWVLLEINDAIVIVNKKRLGMNNTHDFGELFLDYLPRNSFGYKILQRTQPQIFTVNHEWKDKIDFILEPSDEDLKKFFSQTWDNQMYERVIPKRSLSREFFSALGATTDIFKSVIKSKILSKL